MPPRHLVITGYYGFGNAGDDAILQAMVAQLRRRWPEVRISVVTYPHGDSKAVRRLVEARAIDGADVAAVGAVLDGADCLLVGGGGLIQDYLPSPEASEFSPHHGNLAFWTTMVLAARALEVPAVGYALGVGPLNTEQGRRQAGLLLSQMGLVSVRDQDSAELAATLGVDRNRIALTADPVYLLDPAPGDPLEQTDDDLPRSGSKRVVVAVRNWEGDWIDELAGGLDRVVERFDADVLFLPFQQSGRGLDNDGLVSTKVAARMARTDRRGVIGIDLSPAEKLAVVNGADLVIGMRLHSVIYAALAGVPVVALEYDPKVRIAMRELELDDLCLDLEGLSAGELVAAAESALGLPADRRNAYKTARDRLVEQARGADSQLAAFLEAPSSPDIDPEVVAVMGRAAIARAGELYRTEVELGDLREQTGNEIFRLRTDLDNLTRAYDKLAAEYQAFMDSRAVRLVRSMWTLRAGLKGAPRRIARAVLPHRMKRALRKVTGPGESQPPAPTFSDDELAKYRAEVSEQLSSIVRSHRDGPGFVILPPSIGWDVELFQRPQQIALAFARLGYAVLYHLEPKYRGGLVGYRPRAAGVYEGYLPESLEDLLHAVPEPIFLAYVYNFAWREHLEHPLTVYEHIDDLEVFEHVYRREHLDEWHRAALAGAEVVAASALDLLNEVKGGRPDAVLVPNGVDYAHFDQEVAIPTDMADLVASGRPIVGYYGALAEWFDYELLGAVARQLKDVEFVLIGPDYDGTITSSGVADLANVHWLGPRPYAELPGYLACFDVATVPFVVNEVTHAVSPLKLFEYMAGGKPVVTPPLRECARYRAVQIGEGVDGFVAELRRGLELGKDPEHVALLRHTARANTWDARVQTIIEAVEGAVTRRS